MIFWVLLLLLIFYISFGINCALSLKFGTLVNLSCFGDGDSLWSNTLFGFKNLHVFSRVRPNFSWRSTRGLKPPLERITTQPCRHRLEHSLLRMTHTKNWWGLWYFEWCPLSQTLHLHCRVWMHSFPYLSKYIGIQRCDALVIWWQEVLWAYKSWVVLVLRS